MSERDSNEDSAKQGIGRIQRVNLQDVWSHEALDFTPWLQDNIDVLGDAIGLDLSAVEREQPAGAFKVDLIAEDRRGRAVVVENQLEKSDHDHLGKLLTYVVETKASQAVWIVANPRPEHMRVITWLNDTTDEVDFFLLRLEAVKIGDSEPAPLLTQVVGPSEPIVPPPVIAERDRLRYRFFNGLLEYANSRIKLHANISPSRYNWIGAGSGIAGVTYNYVVRQHDARVELYINKQDGDENRRIFRGLESKKGSIESGFGGSLHWDPKEGKQACGISKTCRSGGYRDEGKWKAVYEELVDAMKKLESSVKPHLGTL